MTPFARITDDLDRIALTVRPVARLFYRYLLRLSPPGRILEIELEDFSHWSGETRSRPYSLRQVKRGLSDLIEAGLVDVTRKFSSGCYRLMTHRPDDGTKKSANETKKSSNRTKKSKTEGSNPHCAVPHYREGREQQTPHPSHPVGGLKNVEWDEVVVKTTAPTTTESDRTAELPTTTKTPSTATKPPTAQAQNPNPTATTPTIENSSQQLLEQIEDLEIRVNPQIEKVVRNATVQAVKDAIALVKQKRQQQSLKNPAGFLVKAIANRWQPSAEGVSCLDRHPIADNPSTVDPADLRAQYEAIEREFDSPAYWEAKARAKQEIDRIRSLLETSQKSKIAHSLTAMASGGV